MDNFQWFYGRDGGQQGPVSGEELRRLAQSGGLRPTDLVWREGMAQWTPAHQVPGLFVGAAAPPPMPGQPGMTPAYAPPPPGAYVPPQSIGQDAGIRMLIPVGRSGWAIAAGYLGLFSVLIMPAPLALIISIIAIRDIKKHPDRHGMGRAVFGLIMGALGTIVLAFFLFASVMSSASGRGY